MLPFRLRKRTPLPIDMDDDMDHFAFVAGVYDRIIPSPDPRRLLSLLDLPVTGALLDAGGGTGRASSPLVDLVGQLVVSDLSSAMLARARVKRGLTPLRAHAERLPFPDESFERIMVVDALHHFCDQRQAIGDLMRVLKTGGAHGDRGTGYRTHRRQGGGSGGKAVPHGQPLSHGPPRCGHDSFPRRPTAGRKGRQIRLLGNGGKVKEKRGMHNLNKMILNLGAYLKGGLWSVRVEEHPPAKAFAIRLLRTAFIAVRKFAGDDCLLRASSLTFFTLLSVVPVAAMAFGIAKGFGFEKRLQAQLLDKIPGQEAVLIQVVDSAHRFLNNTKGGLIAGIGVVVLFWSVIKVLSHIENAFNHIWQIEKARPFGRKFADYLSIMLLGPVLVIMSGSFTVFITTQVTAITEREQLLGMFSPLIFALLKLVPYGLLWLLFTIIYLLMPNTRVRLLPGLVAGILAGTLYQIAQWGYISFQIGVAKYNAIYGSFAALPLFLIWLQLSWMIVLLGAEISFAGQNSDHYVYDEKTRNLSFRRRQLISLAVAREVIRGFSSGKPAPGAKELSRSLGLPLRTVQIVADDLVASNILSRIEPPKNGVPAYQPAVDTGIITAHYVTHALAKRGDGGFPLTGVAAIDTLSDILESFDEASANASANRLLKDI